MNEDNAREHRVEEVPAMEQEDAKISKEWIKESIEEGKDSRSMKQTRGATSKKERKGVEDCGVRL